MSPLLELADAFTLAAACADSFPTGSVSFTGAPVSIASASGGNGGVALEDGGTLLDWGINFYENPAGTDCFLPGIVVRGKITIYTSQRETASKATRLISASAMSG